MKYLKKIITKIFKIILLILIVGTAILNTVYSLEKTWDSTYILKIGQLMFYTEKTSVMEPNIKKQDLILIKKQEDYTVNDIIVFTQNGEIKVRRITGNNGNNIEDSYTAKGDKNFYNEPYEIHKTQIKGKVMKVYKNFAFLLRFAQSKVLLIINTILLSIIAYYRIKIKIRVNKKRKK